MSLHPANTAFVLTVIAVPSVQLDQHLSTMSFVQRWDKEENWENLRKTSDSLQQNWLVHLVKPHASVINGYQVLEPGMQH